jgi:ABC-type multidrug transport system ATPase subunit
VFGLFILAFSFLIFFIENQRLMERWSYLCNTLQLCGVKKKACLRQTEIPLSALQDDDEDQDVKKERMTVQQIIESRKMSDQAMVISNLSKQYDCGGFKAVKDISFTIKRGECFGLLGTNGAGKTSSFEMMSANLPKTSGKCYLNGCDSDGNLFEYKHHYGYCPQNDALNDYMTAYEMLRYMLMIRGCPKRDIREKVNFWLKKMDIEKYQDTPICNYSGGTKRKLNTAMAMIGDPQIIFLDEPTTGVDPLSRRYVWECIKKKQNSGETIVLTSHSMDECEMLCNRLAIMAKGELKCIGYIQNLKSKFGKGFSLIIKTKQSNTPVIAMSQPHYDMSDSPAVSSVCYHPDIKSIKLDIENKFTCILRDEHDVSITQYFFYNFFI